MNDITAKSSTDLTDGVERPEAPPEVIREVTVTGTDEPAVAPEREAPDVRYGEQPNERTGPGEEPEAKTAPHGAYADVARQIMRKSADTLMKGAEEARKGASRLIEKSRKISIQTPDWATAPLMRPKFAPRADFSMRADHYEIAIELPGLTRSDVHVTLADGQIIVTGEKTKSGGADTDRTYFVQERQFGSFERSFRRPNDADPAGIEARFERNVLKITLPKFPQAILSGREIEVKTD